MSTLVIDQATKRYGETRALDEVCLTIAAGEFVTLLGPSGCGKSTMLRAIAGLIEIDRGAIAIGGQDITRLPIHRRNIGMVFQNLALFPHMTVAENIAFGLKMRGIARDVRARKVQGALALVRLPDFGARYPHQLSGGQQQRVAIARALVIDPGVMLLDEPFAALDRKLREEMQIELRELTRRVGITAVFVTHDQEEALTLSDRIVVMSQGRVEQIGTPDAVYSRPETRFVADFMGARNILETELVRIAGASAVLTWHGRELVAPLLAHHWLAPGNRVGIALRPELIRIETRAAAAAPPALAGRVASRIDQGAYVTLTVAVDGTSETLVVRQPKGEQSRQRPFQVGDSVTLSWNPAALVMLRDAPRSAGAAPVATEAEPILAARRIA